MKIPRVVFIGAGLALAVLAGWAAFSGCSEEQEGASISLSPTPETTPDASPGVASPTAVPRETAVLYSEFGSSQDTIWLAPLSTVQQPRTIAVVPHAPSWGISASLSPDSQQVAYVVLTPTVPDPERAADDQAELWLQPIAGGEPRLLAKNADVRVAPMWSPDAASLVFQRFSGNSSTLFRVNIADGAVSLLASFGANTVAFPLAFAPEGDRFYVAQTSQEGTDLLAINVTDGSTQTVTKIEGGIARDWDLSPDGRSIAFVNRTDAGEWQLAVASLVEDAVSRLESSALPSDRELFSPAWHPDEPRLAVGTAPGDGGEGVVDVPVSGQDGQRLPGPAEGFDIPLAWSPDGDHLVVQQFSEYPVQRRPSLSLVSRAGERQALAEGREITFIGWIAGS